MTVSIVMPAFNSERFITEAIASVRAQYLKDWELIIIDDGSTDQTISIVEQVSKNDPRIRLLSQRENAGPAAARNRGIEAATGRYIAFLDSDDLWRADKLSSQLDFMSTHECALSYTHYSLIDDQTGKTIGKIQSPQRVSEDDLMRSNQIACSTALYDTQMTGKVFMPLIPKRQDWGLWLEIARQGHIACNVNKDLALYRMRKDGVSGQKLKALLHTWYFFRDVAKIPLLLRIGRIINYAIINKRKYDKAQSRASNKNKG